MDTNKELCIRCGKETEYDVSTPVDMRQFYAEGSGQLCKECWWELYEQQHDLSIPTIVETEKSDGFQDNLTTLYKPS